ncbi:hypothetical protein GcC1_c15632o12 [Golovinomyces cichoracearum]|uniref:Uncharacterized protein n=1 Tax=Golovinomyces cichoracearum TaxID=62708 RepID=A0A420IYG8_9PEZI|nr:hypothetical protein GcC1_c15632o12 [Golovinomyces cichoracearum]
MSSSRFLLIIKFRQLVVLQLSLILPTQNTRVIPQSYSSSILVF